MVQELTAEAGECLQYKQADTKQMPTQARLDAIEKRLSILESKTKR